MTRAHELLAIALTNTWVNRLETLHESKNTCTEQLLAHGSVISLENNYKYKTKHNSNNNISKTGNSTSIKTIDESFIHTYSLYCLNLTYIFSLRDVIVRIIFYFMFFFQTAG